MKPEFNVIIFEFNSKKFEKYNVIPYLLNEYKKYYHKLEYKDLKDFVLRESKYQFWARCEYEIILTDWPNYKNYKKIDVFDQININIDLVVEVLKQAIENENNSN